MADNTLLHRWFEEVWNKGREEAIDEMLAEDIIAHGLLDEEGNTIVGIAKFKPFFRKFREAFPDIHVTVEDTVSEGNKITGLCRVRATHSGQGIGVRPTNKQIDFTGIAIIKIEDGKIIEAWNQFDFMSMYQQLGALNLILDA